MKAFIVQLFVVFLLSGDLLAAQSADDLSGNWKGVLNAGQLKLRIVFKFSKSAAGYSAKMNSPDQGARDIPADEVTFTNSTVQVELKTLNIEFTGIREKGKSVIAGTFKQGGQSMPLRLEKFEGALPPLEEEKFSPTELPANKEAALKVTGDWDAALTGPIPLRLKLTISKTPAGLAIGRMDSLDQAAKDIPVSGITLREGKVRFELPGIGGAYEGTLESDGKVMKGEWRQGGQTFPLEFKKAVSAK